MPLRHVFMGNGSRLDSACPIQPLPPESLEVTPLGTLRGLGNGVVWEANLLVVLCSAGGEGPRNLWGSDLGDQDDEVRAAPRRAQAPRVGVAGFDRWLQPRSVQLPRRPGPTHSAAANH